MQKTRVRRAGALLVGLSLFAAACGDDEKAETPAGGDLTGFKGTTPLTPLGDEFKARLLKVDAELVDFNYAAEGYDLTMIIALAAAKAETDGIAYASEIQGITRDGEKCTDFASCMAIIDAGGDPDYDGMSGPITLNGVGDPLEASYGVLTMGADNRIDEIGRASCRERV